MASAVRVGEGGSIAAKMGMADGREMMAQAMPSAAMEESVVADSAGRDEGEVANTFGLLGMGGEDKDSCRRRGAANLPWSCVRISPRPRSGNRICSSTTTAPPSSSSRFPTRSPSGTSGSTPSPTISVAARPTGRPRASRSSWSGRICRASCARATRPRSRSSSTTPARRRSRALSISRSAIPRPTRISGRSSV